MFRQPISQVKAQSTNNPAMAAGGALVTAKTPARPPTATMRPERTAFQCVTRSSRQYPASSPAAAAMRRLQTGFSRNAKPRASTPQRRTQPSAER